MSKSSSGKQDINAALDAIASVVEDMRSEKDPEFVFVNLKDGHQRRTQNASIDFSKRLAFNLLVYLGLDHALDVVEMYEETVDAGEGDTLDPAARTIH